MARPTARVQGVGLFLLLYQLANPDQILARGMDLAGFILGGCPAELIVDGLLDVAHCFSPNILSPHDPNAGMTSFTKRKLMHFFSKGVSNFKAMAGSFG
jgi:hypothetical protein